MAKVTDRELKKYYSRVSKTVFCSRKQKKEFIQQLKENVEEYVADTPDATIEDIKNSFGTPETIAESFMVNTDSAKIKKQIQIKKMIFIALIVALGIYALFVVLSLIDVHTEAHGYFEEGFLTVGNIIEGGMLR